MKNKSLASSFMKVVEDLIEYSNKFRVYVNRELDSAMTLQMMGDFPGIIGEISRIEDTNEFYFEVATNASQGELTAHLDTMKDQVDGLMYTRVEALPNESPNAEPVPPVVEPVSVPPALEAKIRKVLENVLSKTLKNGVNIKETIKKIIISS
jgi:hypothetical protein